MNPEAALRDLQSPSARVRDEAAAALGSAPPELAAQASAALRAALSDDQAEIRYTAALSLGELEDAEAVEPLLQQMEGDGHPMPRQAAIIALSMIGDLSAVPRLIRALRQGPPDVRFQAATSLATLAPQDAEAPLRSALGDADVEVRTAAVQALGDLGGRGCVPALTKALEDVPTVRFEAAMALARLGDARGSEVLLAHLGDRELGPLAAEHLFRCTPRDAAPALRRSLRRWLAPAAEKVWAAAALARLGEALGRESLLRFLRSRRQSVRGLAIQAMGEVAEPWAIGALRELRAGPSGAEWAEEIDDALQAATSQGGGGNRTPVS